MMVVGIVSQSLVKDGWRSADMGVFITLLLVTIILCLFFALALTTLLRAIKQNKTIRTFATSTGQLAAVEQATAAAAAIAGSAQKAWLYVALAVSALFYLGLIVAGGIFALDSTKGMSMFVGFSLVALMGIAGIAGAVLAFRGRWWATLFSLVASLPIIVLVIASGSNDGYFLVPLVSIPLLLMLSCIPIIKKLNKVPRNQPPQAAQHP